MVKRDCTAEEIKEYANEEFYLGDYKVAIALYTKAIEMESRAVYHGNRAAAFMMLGLYRGAIVDCHRAFEHR
ncbi:hypothetical protein K493DRAFT_51897 [Basidiobolus meristosporus CBS 931.73]|uniref:TPR-like protein n=1 Tax=Basidiobolus meristosporus CBS 931.73 TaxID=1314790 RepID=A0A1Y1Z2T8_9FUNG|nr:hypothetical protein K493DRAFT_51897 [Basidiobolus meristosporus CBS 931.73]|eukprot:ORY04598.1 hypothetical protein K493DRAFT_51897 [Basidiobolus meristosporus CBS 931.73]